MEKFNPIIEVIPDSDIIPEVRIWSVEKYKLVGHYCDIFTAGMKNKWNQLVYIDLFAGAGYSKIADSGKILFSSALIAMSIPNPFSKYILCEKDTVKFKALKQRVKKHFPNLNVVLLNIDSNNNVDKIKEVIPKFSKGNTLLPFCFVDPFSLELSFSTIAKLGENLMDFLILQALHMDANRNLEIYIQEENGKIANYLGDNDWRQKFIINERENKCNFVRFLALYYQNQMNKLGYKPVVQMHQIRSNIKNLPLYYLAFYSKHPTGHSFFKSIEKSATPQLKMEF